MAERTDWRFTRLLMFEAVPYSSASILVTRATWSRGGIMSEIMLVPLPRALSRPLISFLIFQISMFLSDSCSAIFFFWFACEKTTKKIETLGKLRIRLSKRGKGGLIESKQARPRLRLTERWKL